MATPLSVEAPDTSLGSKDKGLTTKLNAAVGNITSNTAASDRQHELSQRFFFFFECIFAD